VTSHEVLDLFRDTGALLEGHFQYTSGRHGRQFLQAARVLQYPDHTERLCKALAARFADEEIDLVVGPATGGIILAYETARHLNCRAAFTEKNGDGMALKRGIRLDKGTRVLLVEDITTTGGSVQKSIDHLASRGALIIGVGVLVDRSAGQAAFDCSFESLAAIEMESWTPENCPLCAAGEDLIEPDDLIV
jgi:orotate phosphoribosyltransferase